MLSQINWLYRNRRACLVFQVVPNGNVDWLKFAQTNQCHHYLAALLSLTTNFFLPPGLDGETVELSADLSEIKAKEDRKRKTKLDGLDEKNILINNDKRQQLLPGALNERKMFEVQQQQDAIFPSVAASNNSLAGSLNSTAAAKMNSNASTEEY